MRIFIITEAALNELIQATAETTLKLQCGPVGPAPESYIQALVHMGFMQEYQQDTATGGPDTQASRKGEH